MIKFVLFEFRKRTYPRGWTCIPSQKVLVIHPTARSTIPFLSPWLWQKDCPDLSSCLWEETLFPAAKFYFGSHVDHLFLENSFGWPITYSLLPLFYKWQGNLTTQLCHRQTLFHFNIKKVNSHNTIQLNMKEYLNRRIKVIHSLS